MIFEAGNCCIRSREDYYVYVRTLQFFSKIVSAKNTVIDSTACSIIQYLTQHDT